MVSCQPTFADDIDGERHLTGFTSAGMLNCGTSAASSLDNAVRLQARHDLLAEGTVRGRGHFISITAMIRVIPVFFFAAMGPSGPPHRKLQVESHSLRV